jgi:hypothetical protein
VTLCHDYPSVLDDLTLTEECVIARCHPLPVIVRLRPGGRRPSISHRALRGHFIVIPQDPGPLLQILPSPDLRLDTLIKVFWLGDRPPTYEDLSPFLVIRRAKVLAALTCLFSGFTAFPRSCFSFALAPQGLSYRPGSLSFPSLRRSACCAFLCYPLHPFYPFP